MDKINIYSIKPQADKWFSRVADNIKKKAKEYVPVDSGDLRESISVQKDTINTSSSYGVGYIIGSDLEYAGMVELGTRHKAARPYLRPALRNRDNYRV